jgi:hypothetical protein
VADVVVSHAAVIPGNPDGTPAFNWGIAKIDDASATAADAVPGVTVFPDLQLDDVLTLNQRNWLITRVGNLGLPTGWITPGITVRQALRTIGRYLDDKFDIDWLSIAG